MRPVVAGELNWQFRRISPGFGLICAKGLVKIGEAVGVLAMGKDAGPACNLLTTMIRRLRRKRQGGESHQQCAEA